MFSALSVLPSPLLPLSLLLPQPHQFLTSSSCGGGGGGRLHDSSSSSPPPAATPVSNQQQLRRRRRRAAARFRPGVSGPPGTEYEDPVACASRCLSTMAWYPLPQSGAAMSAGDEFFENQSAGWSLWSFTSDDDHDTAAAYPDTHGSGGARSEDGSAPVLLEPLPCTEPTDDIFLSQFSDEEMRRMDAPFEVLDMFPDSMHRLLSYEDMLSGVLTGVSSEDEEVKLDHGNGVDGMDTCGFPLFSHDLQDAEPNGSDGEEILPADTLSMDKVGMRTVKRSRSFADGEGTGGFNFEALVLEELEDVVFQLTKKTRICFRDAFFRMAETSSDVRCGSGRQSAVKQEAAEGNAPRVPAAAAAGCCPERATNAIDRTVADLTMRSPCPAPLQVHGSCLAGGSSGAEAQSTTGWTATA